MQNIIDMNNYKKVETDILNHMNGSSQPQVTLDLTKTDVLFSSGIGMLVRLKSAAEKFNKKLCLVNVSTKIREGLLSMSLDRVIPIYSTTQHFLDAQGKQP